MDDLKPHDMDVLQELAKGPKHFVVLDTAESAAFAYRVSSLAEPSRGYVVLKEAAVGMVATLTDKGVEAVVQARMEAD